jgi:hypothetical protein
MRCREWLMWGLLSLVGCGGEAMTAAESSTQAGPCDAGSHLELHFAGGAANVDPSATCVGDEQ